MQRDIALKQLMKHNDVFAEVFNVLACKGRPILDPENLVEGAAEAVTQEKGGMLHEGRRDVVKVDRRGGRYRLICDLENQSGVDNTMPERIMGYDYAAYEKQIHEICEENNRNNHPAWTKRIHKDQKLAPALTVVLYWGDKNWDGPTRLHEMLEFPEEAEDVVRGLVPDYPVNLISMKDLSEKERSNLCTDLRLVADYVATRKDKRACKKIMASTQLVDHPKDLYQAMKALGGDKDIQDLINQSQSQPRAKKEEDDKMTTFQDIINEFVEERYAEIQGLERRESICTLIQSLKDFLIPTDQICAKVMEKYQLSQQEAESYMAEYTTTYKST